jgi:DNA-binding NtrC family response regulator
VIVCAGPELSPDELPKPFQRVSERVARKGRAEAPSLKVLREQWLAPLEKRYLVELLAEHHGNVRTAAAAAGIDPVTMYRLLRRRGVILRRTPHVDEG